MSRMVGRRPVSSLEKTSSSSTRISKAPVLMSWLAKLFANQTAPKVIILFSATVAYQAGGCAKPRKEKTFSPPRRRTTTASWANPASWEATTPMRGGGYCSASIEPSWFGYRSSRNFLNSRKFLCVPQLVHSFTRTFRGPSSVLFFCCGAVFCGTYSENSSSSPLYTTGFVRTSTGSSADDAEGGAVFTAAEGASFFAGDPKRRSRPYMTATRITPNRTSGESPAGAGASCWPILLLLPSQQCDASRRER
mmetsp:Transcript_19739/g.62136  ORF Transcript_19739/g.62136 Transcript_19739/m.62136 type:complete len:250 (-) Transcript_19739:5-754(-)